MLVKRFSFAVNRFASLLLAVLACHSAVFGGIPVPATADVDLAGMPDGSSVPWYDYAPQNSPVQVSGIPIVPGRYLSFSATGSGTVDRGIWWIPYAGPDGYPLGPSWPGLPPPQNGIANPGGAPSGSLVGVFLDNSLPTASAAPDHPGSVPGGLDYYTLNPGLKQVFYIGDGYASGGTQQEIVVPEGATRLFLGYADFNGNNWNNGGSFDVNVAERAIPEPSTLIIWSLLASLGIGLAWWRRRRTA
jgi:hypothetical protein